ncbi:MAG: aspartate aminotransferase family protein [Anaerolineae bacterium]
MKKRDHTQLLADLAEAYARHSPRSKAIHERAKKVQIDGGSHTIRLIEPFPPRIIAAQGAYVTDEDGHQILDFWQGHMANILGQNPPVVTAALARALEEGVGLQTGFTDQLQAETAEILCRQTGAERIRFTSSGTLATMYSIILSRAFTGRDLVMKVGGGWHGAQPWALKGINYHNNADNGFQKVESGGVPGAVVDEVIVSGFNDPEKLRNHFREYGDRVACFIVEPFLGAGGLKAASLEYLRTARELTQQYGSVLIFDEVISGFRFCAGGVGRLYGVQPDLATFGKIVGGGMPLAAVVGRADIMNLAGREGGSKVRFSGGTYSAHPASLLAAKTVMSHLVEHEAEIYPYLAHLGKRTREMTVSIFEKEGICAKCTGNGGDVLPGSSLFMLHFPYDEKTGLERPEDWSDPSKCDIVLTNKVLDLALLLEDVFTSRSHGAMSVAHTDSDLDRLGEACRAAARRIKRSL